MKTGIRELKTNFNSYIRRVEAGERIVVTAHGRVVAELVPPLGTAKAGVITPPIEDGDPLEGCPVIRLPRGTASALVDSDRGDA